MAGTGSLGSGEEMGRAPDLGFNWAARRGPFGGGAMAREICWRYCCGDGIDLPINIKGAAMGNQRNSSHFWSVDSCDAFIQMESLLHLGGFSPRKRVREERDRNMIEKDLIFFFQEFLIFCVLRHHVHFCKCIL